MSRPMTVDEQRRFKWYFPGLDVKRAVVTDGMTTQYNCIAWTVGITTRWIWPGGSLADFDTFYARRGYSRSSNEPLAAWALSGTMTHGCISGAGHGPRWESKCGKDLRIQHGLGELEGSAYGHVAAFYRKTELSDIAKPLVYSSPEEVGQVDIGIQNAVLQEAVSAVSRPVVDEFERRFSSWKETWVEEHSAHLSNPAFVTHTREFSELVAMGREILPLIVGKLTDSENFLALQLYEAVEVDANLRVRIEAGDEAILEGEQGRALRTVERWIANH